MSIRSFLHKVKWFQVLQYNSHNLTWVLCLHTVCSISPINWTLLGATILGQSGPRSNDNEEVLHIPPNLQNWCLNIRLLNIISRTIMRRWLPFCRDVVSVFYCPSQLDLKKSWIFLIATCIYIYICVSMCI